MSQAGVTNGEISAGFCGELKQRSKRTDPGKKKTGGDKMKKDLVNREK